MTEFAEYSRREWQMFKHQMYGELVVLFPIHLVFLHLHFSLILWVNTDNTVSYREKCSCTAESEHELTVKFY